MRQVAVSLRFPCPLVVSIAVHIVSRIARLAALRDSIDLPRLRPNRGRRDNILWITGTADRILWSAPAIVDDRRLLCAGGR